MKVLLAVHDVHPDGVLDAHEGEILRFGHRLCRRRGCVCERAFTGIITSERATLGVVMDVKDIRLDGWRREAPGLDTILAQLDAAEEAQMYRVRYNWTAHGGVSLPHLDSWKLERADN